MSYPQRLLLDQGISLVLTDPRHSNLRRSGRGLLVPSSCGWFDSGVFGTNAAMSKAQIRLDKTYKFAHRNNFRCPAVGLSWYSSDTML